MELFKRNPIATPRTSSNNESSDEPDFQREQEGDCRYQDDQFLQKVLQEKLTANSKGKPIVIIGEPGSGKTTLLRYTANFLYENKHGFPIWISLADIKESSNWLEEFLYKIWLKDVAGKKQEDETPAEWKESFDALIKSGKVCLMLDGADEMAVDAPTLKLIKKQITKTWLERVTVVLTCRLNLWESSQEDMNGSFDIYRTLEFETTRINNFIDKRFGQDNKNGQDLKKLLDSPERKRLQELVKNPLRLALLCYLWKDRNCNLPNTKAEFYQFFVEKHFAWKNEQTSEVFEIPSEQKEALIKQLAILAKNGIDSKSSQFPLRKSSIEGDPNNKGSLFWWALKLGWLLDRGKPMVGEPNSEEKVYAFPHRTFQEYFAAVAIDDWDYFLPKEHTEDQANIKIPPKNADNKYKPYRIFESKWKEVILLWMGREVDTAFRTQKENFIEHLVKFQDGWENFYSYRAYFLAAEVIAEFVDWEQSPSEFQKIVKRIPEQVDEWRNGKFEKPALGEKYYYPVSLGAIDVLAEDQRINARNKLEEFKQIEKKKRKDEAEELLRKLEKGNQDLTDRERFVLCRVAECQVENWSELQGDAEKIVKIASQLNADSPILWKAIERLGEIGENNSKAIEFLLSCILPVRNYNIW